MPSFRFLHAADIHLDSPLRGLRARSEEAAGQFAEASRKAFSNLVRAAIERDVAFVIIAGDLYDGDWKDYATGQFFVREAGKLARAGIKLFLIRGNHDAASEISRTLPLPDNVHEFSTRKVDSVEIAELSVVLHGRSFAQRHVADNMAGDFPAARPGWCNIGILHTSLTGRDGHDVYAPCSLDDLLRAGYQYWALGHIHAREVVHADPPIVFPGNLQGRHAREPGPKGATLVTVDNNVVTDLEALELDAARWECPSVDIAGLSDEAELHDAVRAAVAPLVGACEGRPLALRLRLTGATTSTPGCSPSASGSPRTCRPSPRRCRTRSGSKSSSSRRALPRRRHARPADRRPRGGLRECRGTAGVPPRPGSPSGADPEQGAARGAGRRRARHRDGPGAGPRPHRVPPRRRSVEGER
jgi:DNA repair protein SbcD/Mre11